MAELLSLQTMELIQQQLEQYRSEIDAFSPASADELEQYRIRFLGTIGIVKAIFGEMKNVPNDQKKAFGQVLNEFKQLAEGKFEAFKHLQQNGRQASVVAEDLTLPGEAVPTGSRHPISIVRNQIISIFSKIGFTVAEGPEIEDDWHNFTALNLPDNHPARDMQDTFYISQDPAVLLRTQTSSVQVRVMEEGVLPIRQVFPGRVFRNETVSARAHCFFHQVEGLYIDTNVSFADLKQVLYHFVTEMFGPETKVRFRPSYFPFTEPSAEMDVSCFICGGKGCNVCKHTGWVEILGCGMVHPNVLRNCGIDPEVYTGFAFGMGIERITMMKYGIKDLRLFSENDVRFLRQFDGVME